MTNQAFESAAITDEELLAANGGATYPMNFPEPMQNSPELKTARANADRFSDIVNKNSGVDRTGLGF